MLYSGAPPIYGQDDQVQPQPITGLPAPMHAGTCSQGQLLLLSAVDQCCIAPSQCLAVTTMSDPPPGACNATSQALCRGADGACNTVNAAPCVQANNSCTPAALGITCPASANSGGALGTCDGTGYCGVQPLRSIRENVAPTFCQSAYNNV